MNGQTDRWTYGCMYVQYTHTPRQYTHTPRQYIVHNRTDKQSSFLKVRYA